MKVKRICPGRYEVFIDDLIFYIFKMSEGERYAGLWLWTCSDGFISDPLRKYSSAKTEVFIYATKYACLFM